MKEELMRRISAALDSPDGLAGDPVLQDELRGDAEANKYTKDVARVGKWLAVWPLPEPDDAAFEALASRIEQRLDEPLGAISDPTMAPAFEDDDALRDATAGLLQSGEYRVSDSSIVLLSSDPAIPIPDAASAPLAAVSSSEPKPVAPIAKVALSKARVPTIVEEASASGTGEPMSAADLELRLAQPKKKKKKKAEGASASGAAAARTKSSDRISIPTPKPNLAAPSLSPVVQLPKAEEKRPGTFWWFAAAAAVGLGMFGAATLFDAPAAPTAESARGSTLVTSGAVMPTSAVAEAPVAAVPVAAAPLAGAPLDVVPTPAEIEAAPPPPPTTIATTLPPSQEPFGDSIEPRRRAMATGTTSAAPYAPARIAEAPMHAAGGGGRRMDDVEDPSPAASPARGAGASAGPAPRVAPPATSVVTAPAPAPRPEPTTPPATRTATASADVAALPETPDRSTIQAVLEARTAAVAACANGAHGLADIDVVIAGSGRITTATVNGPFAGTPIGSCMARAVRGATFPPFSQPRFEVTYPYHL